MENNKTHAPLTEPALSRKIGDALFAGVIAEAVMEVGQRPGIWQDMLHAMRRGAEGTKEGTADAFLFRAMVDRLLAEYHMNQK